MSKATEPFAAIASVTSFVALLVGHVATIKGLVSRHGVPVLLEAMDFTSGRWICRVNGGGTLRILPEKLVPVPLQDQEMLRLRYDSS